MQAGGLQAYYEQKRPGGLGGTKRTLAAELKVMMQDFLPPF